VNRLVAIALAAVATLAAGSPVAGAGATDSSRLLVTGHEYSLTLSRARIDPGAAIVQFQNSGEDAHNLKVKRVGGTHVFGAPKTESGQLAEFDAHLRRRSTYVLYCSVADHRALGMEAHLRVRRSQ
jgi:plastocyanin